MNRVPRSASQLFSSKKQQPRPGGNKQREEKPVHQITVEPRKKPQTPLTPFDIQNSYKPTKQFTITRSISKSISFSKNGVDLNITPSVSESDLAQSIPLSPSLEFPVKDYYTVEDMLAMKPANYTTKLMTPGFIMLLHLKSIKTNQNQSDQMPKKKKPQRPKQPLTGQPKLLAHDGDRFISSAAAKNVGLYDEKSPEALSAAAQRILNRLNSRNIEKSVIDVKNLNIGYEAVIGLLLDRATMDTEFPERNLQLTNFITYAIVYANESPGFGELLISMSYDAANKLIGESQTVPIASFQCIAVWLSALFNAGMGPEHALYQFFNDVMRNEPRERAIDVIRCGMYICGKKVGPNFEIFYKFLKDHPSHFGYKRFLVEELFNLKDNKWDRRALDPKVQTTGLRIEFGKKQEEEQKEDPHDVDDAETLEQEFRSWLNEEDIQFTKFRPEQIIRLTLRQLPRHFKDANDFVQYVASCLSNISKDSGRLTDIIRDYFDVYQENVRVEESPGLWTLFFMQLSAYMVEGLVKFSFIHEMIMKAMESEHPPRMKNAVFKIAEITGAPLENVLNLMDAMPETVKSDPEFIQGCVALAEYTVPEGIDEIEAGKSGIVQAGVIIRDAVVAALQDEVEDPLTFLESKKNVFRGLFEVYGRNMINVAKHVVDLYQFPTERREQLVSGIEKNIFEAE